MSGTRAGVFGFLCSEADHFYLGASLDIDTEIETVLEQLDRGRAMSYELQQDWRTYGEDAFDITILEELQPPVTQGQLQQQLEAWLTLIPYAELL